MVILVQSCSLASFRTLGCNTWDYITYTDKLKAVFIRLSIMAADVILSRFFFPIYSEKVHDARLPFLQHVCKA